MIGYKCTDKDGCCRGFKFEVGKTYTKDTKKEDLKCCTDTGFHFCRELWAIERESNYKLSESRLFEVIAGDVVRNGDKYCTNSITILREIEGEEKQSLINVGDRNVGDMNVGHRNVGDMNLGNWNVGNRNVGHMNVGDRNVGDMNVGHRNVGHMNVGDMNVGHRNVGDMNVGDRNVGNRNVGHRNVGDMNLGNWNVGDMNLGNWNVGNMNVGYFNTIEPTFSMFNKNTGKKKEDLDLDLPSFLYFDLTVWVSYDTATDEEKKAHKQEIEVCGGFLKNLDYKEAFRISWNKASLEEHKKLFDLPNWNNEIFKEISGIDAEAEIAKEESECGE